MGPEILLRHERKVRANVVFALAKELDGLRRTRFKGRRRVHSRLWLTAAAIVRRAAACIQRVILTSRRPLRQHPPAEDARGTAPPSLRCSAGDASSPTFRVQGGAFC
jgi:hypothetical protein